MTVRGQQPQTETYVDTTQQITGRRLASWTIDVVVIALPVLVFDQINAAAAALILVLGSASYYIYLVGVEGGGTLGHRVMGLSVIDRRSGAHPDAIVAAMRFMVVTLLAIPLAIPWLISAVSMSRRPGCDGWHDHASQCQVVRRGAA